MKNSSFGPPPFPCPTKVGLTSGGLNGFLAEDLAGLWCGPGRSGYDGPMSEPKQDDENPTSSADDTDSGDSGGDSGESGGESGGDSGSGGNQRGVSDEQLPEDLQPTEDNPLARHPGQTGDDDDRIGADSESGNADNPSTNITYGSGGSDSDTSSDSASGSDSGATDAEEDDGSEALDNGGGGAG